jgi:hypothetical protein
MSLTDSFDVKSNKCEICNRVAQGGIIDEITPQRKIRYTCQDHYMAVHERIVQEKTVRKMQEEKK